MVLAPWVGLVVGQHQLFKEAVVTGIVISQSTRYIEQDGGIEREYRFSTVDDAPGVYEIECTERDAKGSLLISMWTLISKDGAEGLSRFIAAIEAGRSE